jgi:predicted GIY-YIG superfamily endonuclease
METALRIPRKRLRLTRSLELAQRNVLRLCASFETRLGTVHWLFDRLAPALDRTKDGASQVTSYRGPWNLIYYEAYVEEADAIGRERYLKSGGGRKLLRSQLRNYFTKHRLEPREAKPFTPRK